LGIHKNKHLSPGVEYEVHVSKINEGSAEVVVTELKRSAPWDPTTYRSTIPVEGPFPETLEMAEKKRQELVEGYIQYQLEKDPDLHYCCTCDRLISEPENHDGHTLVNNMADYYKTVVMARLRGRE
jgi:hypothetical protein